MNPINTHINSMNNTNHNHSDEYFKMKERISDYIIFSLCPFEDVTPTILQLIKLSQNDNISVWKALVLFPGINYNVEINITEHIKIPGILVVYTPMFLTNI